MDKAGNYVIEKDKIYGPENAAWRYVAKDTLSFWSIFISGAHRMDNGNTFINEGARGRFFEVVPNGKTVWEYLNPYRGGNPKHKRRSIQPNVYIYSTFRATLIPANQPALSNKKLERLIPQPMPFFVPAPPPGMKM